MTFPARAPKWLAMLWHIEATERIRFWDSAQMVNTYSVKAWGLKRFRGPNISIEPFYYRGNTDEENEEKAKRRKKE